MSKNKNIEDVEKFLHKTGFILEMEVSEYLRKNGYTVYVNQYFTDYDTDKKREIDLICVKKINDIELNLIIECKQSLVDDWIFICSDRSPMRYYNFIKHTPSIEKIKESKIFDNLHIFDKDIPFAQNYIIKDKTGEKSTSQQIDTCLEKLPKALVNFVYNSENNNLRKIYLPIAVFSNDIFTAQYNKKLTIKLAKSVQFQFQFSSKKYIHNFNYKK